MNIYQIKAGTTDVSVVIRIIDSTDGTPETGVVYNTSGIDLEYRRELAASTDITEATLAALTTAHADGGFLHIGNGYYRLDLPDAAVAAGATGVLVHGTVTGMVVIGCYIQLVAYDPFDTVRLGLTALPNAAAEASGGLYTRGTGAGQINQANNGQIDANAARTGGTTNTGRDIGASVLLSSGTGTGQLSLSSGLVTLAGVTHTGAVIPTVTTLTGHTAQTGDAYARLGAPAGASVSADVAAVKADTAATLVDTAEIGAAGAGLTVLATAANLATVAGYLDTEIAAILADTNELQTDWANGGRLDLILDARASQTSVDDLPTNAELATSQAAADDATLAAIAALTIPSAATIADAVWDETLSGHVGSGSTGEALGAAGAAGDPWITALPGSYSSGQAGYIVGTNLNATVSSRASQTSVDTIDDFLDTEVAAILADTNELQTDWANGGRLDLILDARASQTSVDDLPTNAELATSQAAADDATLAAIAAVDTKIDTIDNFLDTEIAAIITTLGTPAGASVSADIAAIEAQTDDIGAAGAGLTALASAANLATLTAYVDTEVAAIKAKTDSLTFTVAGVVDANIQYVNDTAVTGDGSPGTEWGP